MKMKLHVPGTRSQVPQPNLRAAVPRCGSIENRKSKIENEKAFTLIEMMVTLALLSFIVLALMAVFNSTQKAFRAGLTQTDFLGSGRLAMDMIANDLEKMTPSYGTNEVRLTIIKPYPGFLFNLVRSPVNFYVDANPYVPGYQPFAQYMPGSSELRSNVLENFFILSRQNVNGQPSWVGTGYVVDPSSRPTNSLYRFDMITNVMKGNPLLLFSNFVYDVYQATHEPVNPFANTINWTHIMDGVVDFRVRPYDPNGVLMTSPTNVYNGQTNIALNTYFSQPPFLPTDLKLYTCLMFSNTVPASVEVQMGVWENATLQHAEGLPQGPAQLNYLSNHVGQVHLFRQRVWIRNVDPTAYRYQ